MPLIDLWSNLQPVGTVVNYETWRKQGHDSGAFYIEPKNSLCSLKLQGSHLTNSQS